MVCDVCGKEVPNGYLDQHNKENYVAHVFWIHGTFNGGRIVQGYINELHEKIEMMRRVSS